MLLNWLMVFLRASGLLAVFPVFSSRSVPVVMRVALGALLAFLVSPILPETAPLDSIWTLAGAMAAELLIGLLLGFVSRFLFFALEIAAGIISSEMGLALPAQMSPLSDAQTTAPAAILSYLAAVLWLSLDLHHWLLVGFQRSYKFLGPSAAHLSPNLLQDITSRTGQIFVSALQMSAPMIAVSFIITLVFAVLARAVPQMNVFSENFAFRILAGLLVLGVTFQLLSQHIVNWLRQLPEDLLRVAQLLGAG